MYLKLIEILAAISITLALTIQIIKVLKINSTDDLSSSMFIFLSVGISLWLLKGILTNDIPIILANATSLFIASIILFNIIKSNKPKRINHIAIWTLDIEKMKKFYCENFNAKAGHLYQNSKNGFHSYFIKFTSNVRLELMYMEQYTSTNNNWGHISISAGSKEQVDLFTKQISEKGIEVISQPRITGDGYYESVIKDPEGNLIEITI